MKRATDFERNHALRAALLAPLAGAPDGIGVAGDHRLVGGIDVRGGGQFLFGSLEHDAGQRDVERLVDRVKHRPRRRKPLRQIFSHTDFLSALTGAEPDRAYHRTTMLPQVKPAPNAQNMTVMPGFRRPHLTASSSAMAMEAAEVFPKRSTLT